MSFDDNKDSTNIKKKIITAEKELTKAGVFNAGKTRTYNELENERRLLLNFLHLQTQYIRELYHRLKD